MAFASPSFTLGVEEEYLIVDAETLDLVEAPDALMDACIALLGPKVSPEFLRCQIEVGTGVCATVADARKDLAHLRQTVKQVCNDHGMAPIAVSTHPFAAWQKQKFTEKDRYKELEKDLAGVARRMLICGMHVHVGIDDDDLRLDLLNQFSYFLPHLLALSTSSPFWEGRQTGLHSYRLTVFDNLPRTGLPPVFSSYSEYERSVRTIIEADIVEDASKLWWDVRPSARFPTLESRICDVMPRIDHAISVTALTQSIFRMLYDLRRKNQRWRLYERFLIEENRWRAQRYGPSEGLIDFGLGQIVPFADILDELIELVTPHAAELGCLREVEGARRILSEGTSSQRQAAVFGKAMEDGAAAASSSAASSHSIGSGPTRAPVSEPRHMITGMISSPSFTLSGISGRSFSFSRGMSTVLIPPRRAASSFSLSPPMGSALPRSVTSPVMAMSLRTGNTVSTDTMEVTIARPALGPSLGVAPSGTCTWMSHLSKRGGFTPICGAIERT
jgi:carboxylate-amine ligase